VLDSTNYLDSSLGPDPQASLNVQYSVAAIIDGETQELSRVVTLAARLSADSPGGSSGGCHPATCPTPNEHYTYSASDASVGDLDGDGRYEIVLNGIHQTPETTHKAAAPAMYSWMRTTWTDSSFGGSTWGPTFEPAHTTPTPGL